MPGTVWLGVDLGDARVGLALSDPELSFAHPAGNIQVWGDSFQALDQVVDVIMENHIQRVVVGLPLLLDGTRGKSARKASRWATNLGRRLNEVYARAQGCDQAQPEVILEDERLTTVGAHRQLFEAAIPSRNHRSVIDQQAAVMILQSALDRRQLQEG